MLVGVALVVADVMEVVVMMLIEVMQFWCTKHA